jgi:poly-beta-hydroxyalkanoate depolymerase
MCAHATKYGSNDSLLNVHHHLLTFVAHVSVCEYTTVCIAAISLLDQSRLILASQFLKGGPLSSIM